MSIIMYIFVEIRYMDHGLIIEKNESIKILKPGPYWQEFTQKNAKKTVFKPVFNRF